jgi:hypothetical protein
MAATAEQANASTTSNQIKGGSIIYHSIEPFLKAWLSQAHALLIYRTLTIQLSALLTQKQTLI